MRIIKNGKVVLRDKLINGDVKIVDGYITEVGKNLYHDKKYQIIDAKNKYVIAGFVDLHSNGAAGFDATYGSYNVRKKEFNNEKKKYVAALHKALNYYLVNGTTKVLLSSIAAPIETIKSSFTAVAEFKKYNSELSNLLYGLYIEGTFIKNNLMKGAHNPVYFQKLSNKLINELNDISDGNVKVVTVPPEWGKLAEEIIAKLSKQGIICSVGHSSATGEQVNKAVKNGMILATHLFNGPSSSSFKPFGNGGVIEAVLKSENVYAEVIPDGFHVDKSYVRDLIKRKGYEKIIAVTDSMFPTGLINISGFNFSGVQGRLSADKKYLYVDEQPLSLFGSVLTMRSAFANLVNWLTHKISGVWFAEHDALQLEEAVIYANKMCSTNSADLLSINNSSVDFGEISAGKKADLLILKISKSKSDYVINIKDILLNGEKIRN